MQLIACFAALAAAGAAAGTTMQPASQSSPAPGEQGPPPLPPDIAARVVYGPDRQIWEECWGPPPGQGPCTLHRIPVYKYLLNDGSYHTDRREYDRMRAALTARGLQFRSAPAAPGRR